VIPYALQSGNKTRSSTVYHKTKFITAMHPVLLIPGRAAKFAPAVEKPRAHDHRQDADELFLYGSDYHELPTSEAEETIQQYCDCCPSKTSDHDVHEVIYLIQSRRYPRFGYAEYY
jgi:hypothetical protein